MFQHGLTRFVFYKARSSMYLPVLLQCQGKFLAKHLSAVASPSIFALLLVPLVNRNSRHEAVKWTSNKRLVHSMYSTACGKSDIFVMLRLSSYARMLNSDFQTKALSLKWVDSVVPIFRLGWSGKGDYSHVGVIDHLSVCHFGSRSSVHPVRFVPLFFLWAWVIT